MDEKTITIPHHQTFNELWHGYNWAAGLTGQVKCQQSRLRDDFFSHVLPRDYYFRLLGIQRAAEKVCRRIEPNGVWNIEVENPGTYYTRAGILGDVQSQTKMVRFSAWYNRFLPYAVAMLKAEWNFPNARGIDFESINAYYGTCCGFVYLGQGDESIDAKDGQPGYDRILLADQDLFHKCHAASGEVRPPQLPFDEAHGPCMVYVAQFRPEILAKMVDKGHWWFDHVNKCCEKMNRPRINFKYRRHHKAA